MDNWYKESKKKRKKKKKTISPYFIDNDGVLKYRTENGKAFIARKDKEKDIDKESKKEKWNPNPWAVCTKSVGRKNKSKYERCVKEVKRKQK